MEPIDTVGLGQGVPLQPKDGSPNTPTEPKQIEIRQPLGESVALSGFPRNSGYSRRICSESKL